MTEFRFDIYARIDGYSCSVPWSYVGVSTQIEIGIYRQNFDVIRTIRYMPSVILSDRGSETPIMAEAYFQLCLGKTDEQKEMTEKEA